MADKNNGNMIWTVGGGGGRLLDMLATDGGWSWYGKAGIHFANMDEFTTLSGLFGINGGKTYGKVTSDADAGTPGTYTQNKFMLGGLEWGFSTRGKFATDSTGLPWFATRTSYFSEILVGKTMLSAPEMTVFGKDYPGSSDSWTTLALAKRYSLGFEFWPSGSFHIMPEVGVRMLAVHPFVDDDKRQEWPFSAQGIEMYLGLSMGFGSPSYRLRKHREITGLGMARYFSQELHSIAYDYIIYRNFTKPQAGGTELVSEVFGEGSATGGGNTWLMPPLLAISDGLGASGKVRPVGFYLKAPLGGKVAGLLLEGAKGLGYTIAGRGGEAEDAPLLSSGFAAMNNLATIGISEVGLEEKYLFLAPYLLGGAEILLSNLAGKDSAFGQGLLGAGTMTSAGWAQNPEQGKEAFIESTSYIISPVGYKLWGNESGLIGSFGVRNYFKDSPLFVGFKISSPALMVANFGKVGANQVLPPGEEQPYQGKETPSFVSSDLGVGTTIELSKSVYIRTEGGISLITQYDSTSPKGGGGVNGRLALGYKVTDKTSIELSVDATLYKTPGDKGVIVTPGITPTSW